MREKKENNNFIITNTSELFVSHDWNAFLVLFSPIKRFVVLIVQNLECPRLTISMLVSLTFVTGNQRIQLYKTISPSVMKFFTLPSLLLYYTNVFEASLFSGRSMQFYRNDVTCRWENLRLLSKQNKGTWLCSYTILHNFCIVGKPPTMK